MKKLMYLLPFAALAMASCSSSEDVAQNVQTPSQELKFFPAVEGTTRGAIETTASISKFYVYANGNLKDAVTAGSDYTPAWQAVNKVGSVWTPTTKMWWATDDELGSEAQATFTAFANALGSAGVMENATEGKLVNVTIPATLANQKDLVVAYNAGKRTDFISGVPLHFRHALSQIVVNATYANDADASLLTNGFPELVVKVKGIKFVGLKNVGTLTLPTASTAAGNAYEPVWTSVDGAESFIAAPATEATLASAAKFIDDSEAGNPLLLMPQTTAATTNLNPTAPATVTGAYLMVEVDIDYKEPFDHDEDAETDAITNLFPKTADATAWIAVPVDIAWKGGYKYTYTLNFSNIAAGKIAPGNADQHALENLNDGDPVIQGARTPVNFLVTVEEAWIDGGSFTPAM